jgi:hypothetical protein
MILSRGLVPSESLANHLRCSQLEAVEIIHTRLEIVAVGLFIPNTGIDGTARRKSRYR